MQDQDNQSQNTSNGSAQPVGDDDSTQASSSTTDPSSTANPAHLAQQLTETQKKLEEMTTFSQRALADLQNYKRRSEEEKAAFAGYANAALFSELLPAIESAHRALQHEPKDPDWAKGVEQTLTLLIKAAQKSGLEEIPAQGEFDPTQHEALLAAPGPKDHILEILEKGYMLGGKILKRARVKVGDGTASQ